MCSEGCLRHSTPIPNHCFQKDDPVSSRQLAAQRWIVFGLLGMAAARFFGVSMTDVSGDERPKQSTVAVDSRGGGIPSADDVWNRELPSAGSGSVKLPELLGAKATVLVFLSTECPISNGYVPTLNQLAKDFAERGVKVIGLNPNENVSLREMALHRSGFSIAFPVLKDTGALVATALKVDHCPEAVIVDEHRTVRYRGRIDDRYSKRGGAANDVQRHDLLIALDELLGGQPVSVEHTKVVGCPIARRVTQTAKPATNPAASVTYSEHVAPVLQTRCETCHRPGGIGPFSLQTFKQAALWADDIQEFTANRQMPPWLPAEGAGDFHNRRSMTADEIALIAKWVEEGCAEGDSGKLPAPHTYSDEWAFGPPDMIVQSSEPFDVPADGRDVYRCFVLPTDFDTDKFVEAIEVRPGNARVVHHVIVFLDVTGRSEQLDAKDPGPGYSTAAGFPGFLPSGGLGGWAPGNLPRRLPTGMAKVLPAKARLVVQVHYHPSGRVERDQTQVGIYFAKQPVTRAVRVIPVMPFGGPFSGMRIPAGDNNAEVTCSITLPHDVLALSVTPHMHLLGKDMAVTAKRPDGSVSPLIRLQRWDFNWQEGYQYREPVSLPKGTRLDLVAHYDNSADNPSNPRRPPKDVRWGENTVDEMCIAFFEVVPVGEARSPEDLKAPTPGELLKEAVLAHLKNVEAKSKRGD
jgi:peroxiredoxin